MRSFLSFFCSFHSADLSCSHKYTEHLNHFPNCSPYIGGVMKVQCIVEVPLNAADITIGWFMNCKQLSNDSDISIESQVHVAADPEVRRIRSRLTINRITDDYAGKYTCNMLGDEEYVPGDQLELGDSEELELESSLGQCLDGGALFPGAIPAPEKCAVITEDNPVPMSLVCDAPPATSSQSQPTSTPVVLPTSTSLPHPSSSSSSSSSPTLSPTNLSSSAPSPTDPIVATSLPTNQDPTSIWLYVVVAIAAVFFMIIVVLAIVCVGMCVHRNRTLDGSPTRELPSSLSPSLYLFLSPFISCYYEACTAHTCDLTIDFPPCFNLAISHFHFTSL